MFSVCLLLSCLASPILADGSQFAAGLTLYRRGHFQQAVRVFEREVQMQPRDSESHHWLGKSLGRLANDLPWYEAITVARRSGKEMEIAVELDPYNAEAVESLMLFYEHAPVLLGGGKASAKRLRERIAQLGLTVQRGNLKGIH